MFHLKIDFFCSIHGSSKMTSMNKQYENLQKTPLMKFNISKSYQKNLIEITKRIFKLWFQILLINIDEFNSIFKLMDKIHMSSFTIFV
jgi:hypothetical protein